jgi:septation ring formation regulator EzrA
MTRKQTNLDDIADSIQGLATHMDERFEQVGIRFEQVDKRFDQVESRLSSIEKEQRLMREWLERIDSRLSGVEAT